MKLTTKLTGLLVAFVLFIGIQKSVAHCEIPCGIYDDSVRIALIYEHITTIEKSMVTIKKLESADVIDYNQLVRWVVNKEEHAQKIQDIISQYYMHQRIKPVDETVTEKFAMYVEQLTLAHQVSVFAMKAKQSTDEVYIKKLRETVHLFEHAYFVDGH